MSLKTKMLSKTNWAVYGISNDKEKFGYKIAMRLKEYGYNVAGINKKYSGEEIDGIKVYSSLKDVPFDIEVVDMVVNPKITNSVLDEIQDCKIKNVWLQPGTFDSKTVERLKQMDIDFIDDDCVYKILEKED